MEERAENNQTFLGQLMRQTELARDVFDPHQVGRRIAEVIARKDPSLLPKPIRKELGRMVAKVLHNCDEHEIPYHILATGLFTWEQERQNTN